ncbi:MAG TPA: hypothetical protein VGH74_07615 [Planctomycetaceae bacterium]|jgi:hypothetical protein
MAIDPTLDVVNQQLQGGADWEVGGKLNLDTVAGGNLQVDDKPVPLKATFSPAAGAANVCLVTLQLGDGNGNMAFPAIVDIYLSDAAAGGALTATTASGAVAAGASGTDLDAMVAKKALRVLTDATGKYILSITDSAKTLFVPCVMLPCGRHVAGTALVVGNYG